MWGPEFKPQYHKKKTNLTKTFQNCINSKAFTMAVNADFWGFFAGVQTKNDGLCSWYYQPQINASVQLELNCPLPLILWTSLCWYLWRAIVSWDTFCIYFFRFLRRQLKNAKKKKRILDRSLLTPQCRPSHLQCTDSWRGCG
jgi:hypothetical protein